MTLTGTLGWLIETVDPGGDVGMYTWIAVNTAGRVHISYRDNGQNDLE